MAPDTEPTHNSGDSLNLSTQFDTLIGQQRKASPPGHQLPKRQVFCNWPSPKCHLEVVAELSELGAAAEADAWAAASAGMWSPAISASASLKPALKERLNSISTELKPFFGL